MNFHEINLQEHMLGVLNVHFEEYLYAQDDRSKHIIMLNIAEEILFYLVGICIGEYKTHFNENLEVEKKLHWYARKKLSFGDLQSILNDFAKLCPNLTICSMLTYPLTKSGHFCKIFKYFKKHIIDKGIDEDFEVHIKKMSSSFEAKPLTLTDVFLLMVQLRNIHAHPLEKAKNPIRSWPLTLEYFTFINPFLETALCEIISVWQELEIGVFQIHSLDNDHYVLGNGLNKSIHFVLDKSTLNIKENQLFVVYQESKVMPIIKEIPPIRREIYELIDREVSQNKGRKVLKKCIRKYLKKGSIDRYEFFRLTDDAETHYLTEDWIHTEIENVKKELNLVGNVLAQEVVKEEPLFINPFWLVHLDSIDDYTVQPGCRSLTTTTGRHFFVWSDLDRFLNKFIQQYMTDLHYDWSHRPNKFQQGRLSGHYWSRMFPTQSSLSTVFNIGFFIRKSSVDGSSWMKKITDDSNTQLFIWLNPDTTNLDRYLHRQEVIVAFQSIVTDLLIKHGTDIPGINLKVLRWNLSTNRKKVCNLTEIESLQLSENEILCPISEFFNLNDVIEKNQDVFEKLIYFAQFLKNVSYRLQDLAVKFESSV